ncbi:MAG TPA: sigma-70 family RNA polymerase sigma factor [Chitinophagaceae bacterium]|nr:sigma-70 family RNA polymerase sigma factor [Chitinophagaceae bacterium]
MITGKTDIELWEAFRLKDRQAFAALFKRYYEPLFQFGLKFTQDTQILEDCIQELFLELWTSNSRTEVRSVKAYLCKSLRYKLFRALSRQSRLDGHADAENLQFTMSQESQLIIAEEDKENRDRILKAYSRLTDRQREIIYLKYFQEMSYEEVSEVMSINYQASRNLLSMAIKSLRKLLGSILLLF